MSFMEEFNFWLNDDYFDQEFLECFQFGDLQCPGKVEHYGNLGHLCGLESGESQVNPSAGAVDFLTYDRGEGQEYYTDSQGRVGQEPVPSQRYPVADVQGHKSHKYKLDLFYKESEVCGLLLVCQ